MTAGKKNSKRPHNWGIQFTLNSRVAFFDTSQLKFESGSETGGKISLEMGRPISATYSEKIK